MSARIAAVHFGCSVTTRWPRIAGNPVRSATSVTATPAPDERLRGAAARHELPAEDQVIGRTRRHLSCPRRITTPRMVGTCREVPQLRRGQPVHDRRPDWRGELVERQITVADAIFGGGSLLASLFSFFDFDRRRQFRRRRVGLWRFSRWRHDSRDPWCARRDRRGARLRGAAKTARSGARLVELAPSPPHRGASSTPAICSASSMRR